MKIIAVVGSPRKGGNCDTLVNKFIDKVDADVDLYYLNDLDMNYCDACLNCQNGECIKDDDLNKLTTEMLDADYLVFATPIWFGEMSAQAKTFVDRFYQVAQNPDKSFEGMKVINIVTQANPADLFNQYADNWRILPYGHLGMDVVDTVIAKTGPSKGDLTVLAEAIEKLEEIAINLE